MKQSKDGRGFIGAAVALVACMLLVDLLPLILAGCTTNSGPVTHSDPAWIFAKEGVTK